MTGNTTSKIKQLAKQIKNNPGDSFSKFALALEFRKQDQHKNARILFEDILESDPDYVGVYYHLGKLYEAHDRLNDAEELYERGLPIAEEQQKKRTLKELQEALQNVQIEIEERQKNEG